MEHCIELPVKRLSMLAILPFARNEASLQHQPYVDVGSRLQPPLTFDTMASMTFDLAWAVMAGIGVPARPA